MRQQTQNNNNNDDNSVERGVLQQIEFTVYGRPAPKGSKGAMIRGGKIVLFESNRNQKPFENLIIKMVLKHLPPNWTPIPRRTPVRVELVFKHRKPKNTNDSAMVVAPDVDKLSRNVLDALTKSGVYEDDCQVNHLIAIKEYEDSLTREGVKIKITWTA